MNRIVHRWVLALLALGLLWSAAPGMAAGRNRAGTAAAPELLIPVGARDLALGGAAIATTAGLEALHWNPAGLARARTDANLLFSTMSYIADIRVNYAAVSGRFPDLGCLALSLKSLDIGAIPITTEAQPDGTGGTFSPTYFILGATYARHLTDRIALGATGHYISNRLDRASATGWSFSAGLQYLDLGNIRNLDLGVALKHIGSRLQFDGPGLLRQGQLEEVRRSPTFYKIETSSADLPSTFEIGLGYRAPMAGPGRLNLTSVFQHHNYDHDQYRVGTEYLYGEFLALRGGFAYAADAADDTFLFGTSFGFGVEFDVGTIKDARLDYAYTTVDHFDGLNTFTFQIGF